MSTRATPASNEHLPVLHVQPHFQRRRITVEEAEAEAKLEQVERERRRKGRPARAKKLRRADKKRTREALAESREPFGRLEDWKALKALMRPGDELWEYCSDRASWAQGLGRAGFYLLRDGKTVADVLVRMN